MVFVGRCLSRWLQVFFDHRGGSGLVLVAIALGGATKGGLEVACRWFEAPKAAS